MIEILNQTIRSSGWETAASIKQQTHDLKEKENKTQLLFCNSEALTPQTRKKSKELAFWLEDYSVNDTKGLWSQTRFCPSALKEQTEEAC